MLNLTEGQHSTLKGTIIVTLTLQMYRHGQEIHLEMGQQARLTSLT